jgi:hypothetical protein
LRENQKKPERKRQKEDAKKSGKSYTLARSGKAQCCGSGMFIADPDFYPSRIPNQTTAIKEDGERNLLTYPFL